MVRGTGVRIKCPKCGKQMSVIDPKNLVICRQCKQSIMPKDCIFVEKSQQPPQAAAQKPPNAPIGFFSPERGKTPI